MNCIILTPNGRVADFCFREKDFGILYMACGILIYSRKLRVKDSNAVQPLTKPEKLRL